MAKRDNNPDPLASNPTPPTPNNDVRDTLAQTKDDLKDQARQLAGQAKQGTQKAAEQAKEQVQGAVRQQKEQLAGRLGSLAGALREAGHKLDEQDGAGLGRYAGRAAEQVERASRYLRERDLNEVVRDAEGFARRHPDLFLGGTFLAGLLVARFLKASSDRRENWEGSGASSGTSRNTGAQQSYRGTGAQRPGAQPYYTGAGASSRRSYDTNVGG